MSHPFKLIRTNGVMISGGYQFHDPITGKTYQDRHTLFDSRVKEIIRDRLANKRLWTDNRLVDPVFVSEQLSVQNCTRLKNNPMICSNGLMPVNQPVDAAPVMAVGRKCRYCGSDKLEEVVCEVCSGRKIVDYKCQSCGRNKQK